MNVAQRATSVTGIGATSGYFTLDRWYAKNASSAGRFTMTQTADGPNGISANCLKLDCTTADTSIAAGEVLTIRQRFEGQNLQRIGKGVAGAKQITVSFYVKANAAFTFGVELFDEDNARQITKLFATTTDWVRHELTFAADEDDGSSPFADDNANSLILAFWLHGGATYTGGTLNTATFANNTNANRAAGIDSFFSSTDNNFFITGVQMEVGPVATEFEQEDISTTLAKCQRYYLKIAEGNNSPICTAFSFADTQMSAVMNLPNAMRATPSIDHVSGTGYYRYTNGTNVAINELTLDVASNTEITFAKGSITVTQGQSGMLLGVNSAAYFALSAEL
tara:strand:- start:225 stop:1235 length:1011 start_codon:yes stop_codon:yes gene_type:complete